MDKPESLTPEAVNPFDPSGLQKEEFNQLLNKAHAFDLRPVVLRYMNKRGVTRARAIEVADEMLKYLCLCAIEPNEEWTITGEVDEMWHTFILFTKRYEQFCMEVAGRFIHHYPGEEDVLHEETASETTQITAFEQITFLENNSEATELKDMMALQENFAKFSKGLPVTACKPINNLTELTDAAISYGNTLKKYHGYLGIPPNQTIWPSPGVLNRPQTPEKCGGVGVCGCVIKTDPNPPKP